MVELEQCCAYLRNYFWQASRPTVLGTDNRSRDVAKECNLVCDDIENQPSWQSVWLEKLGGRLEAEQERTGMGRFRYKLCSN